MKVLSRSFVSVLAAALLLMGGCRPLEATGGEPDATAIEFGLIAALVAVVIIGELAELGTELEETFDSVADSINNSTSNDESHCESPREDCGFRTESSHSNSGRGNDASVNATTRVTGSRSPHSTRIDSQVQVYNSDPDLPAPDAGFTQELTWSVRLQLPGSSRDLYEIDLRLDFVDVDVFIDGPIAGQDFVLDLEAAGFNWGFTVEHDPRENRLNLLDTRGAMQVGDVVFSDDFRRIVAMRVPDARLRLPGGEQVVRVSLRQTANGSALLGAR
ncbi:MAG: Flp family type IVb pilin [Pseudomonadota bacterium]